MPPMNIQIPNAKLRLHTAIPNPTSSGARLCREFARG